MQNINHIINDKSFQKDFLIAEYQETHKYLINVEESMLSLLRFYNSVFAGLVPIAAVFFKFFEDAYLLLLFLAVIISALGVYILAMYLELRIRKIKTLEQIAVFRQKFTELNFEFSEILKMIPSIEKCPPYLRRPSSEWYTVIYISFLNSLVITSVFGLSNLLVINKFGLGPIATGNYLLLFSLMVCFFLFLFLWSTHYCYIFDLKREKQYNIINKYSFLNPDPYFPTIFKPLRFLAKINEGLVKKKYELKMDNIKDKENNVICEFCELYEEKKEVLAENLHAFCKWDKYPVSNGHILIIPKKHIVSFFDLSTKEMEFLYLMILRGKEIIQKKYSPEGYNIGVNIGEVAGQTIPHLHIHLIPRYKGDVEDPEGGVRNIFPEKAKYKDRS